MSATTKPLSQPRAETCDEMLVHQVRRALHATLGAASAEAMLYRLQPSLASGSLNAASLADALGKLLGPCAPVIENAIVHMACGAAGVSTDDLRAADFASSIERIRWAYGMRHQH